MISTTVTDAFEHFAAVDKKMFEISNRAFQSSNPPILPTPKIPKDYFKTLVNSICSQQISTKAAAAIFARLQQQINLTPASVRKVGEEEILACGVTKQKARYITALANSWPDLVSEEFPKLNDHVIAERLVSCYGIGQWTAEMFLMFAMARPDVFSVGDLALRQRVALHYGVEQTSHAPIVAIAEAWSPYRTIASLSLWHEIDNGPVLL